MPHLNRSGRRVAASVLGSVLLTACQPNAPTAPAPKPATSPMPRHQPTALPSSTVTGPGLTPHQRLTTLAANISTTPADGLAGLPYTYLHVQSWTRATNVITRTDVRRWRRDADSSGREITRRLPDVPRVAHSPKPDERERFAAARETTTRYAAGELPPYLPSPLPTDPGTLADMLAPRQRAGEPAYPRMLAGGIVNVATTQYLDRGQRATTLRVLASVPNVAYQGEMTDLAGRAGLGFTVTGDGSTLQIVVEARTGEVLAAEERLIGNRPGLFSSVLILERGHTARDGAASARP
ncbi:hypothetical protein OHQ88_33505 (plasmid) [Micromonospora zamorensis]|uniref:hypothetical protein n=1 Tax=Micromonospora zamorensis TaxID=709883 RepID=UPI002E1AB75F